MILNTPMNISTIRLDGDFAFTEDAGFAGEARVDVDGVSWAAVRTFGLWSLEFDD